VDHTLRERVNRLGLDPRIAREPAEAARRMKRAMKRLETIEFQVSVQSRGTT
jgi:hypothetical protein